MKQFMDGDFLLRTETAKTLFHDYAEGMPIIDYHCHIDPKEIYENRRFDNLAQAWLGGDHYKWRLMRSNGVEERYITGGADDREKFQKFAEALPRAIGNPMYHWCHLELKTYFGYDGALNGKTAERVWQLSREALQSERMSAREIITNSNVKVIGTTDDPADSLIWHKRLSGDSSFPVRVIPSFRPDKALGIEKDGFAAYIRGLGDATNMEISSYEELKRALEAALDKFAALGCRASDHGLDRIVYRPAPQSEVAAIFQRALNGGRVAQEDAEKYRTAALIYLGGLYHERDIVMQLHFGVIRNASTKMLDLIGADAGCDCIGDTDCASGIVGLLNALECAGSLPKTILYSLDPNDNALLASIIGCFQSADARGARQRSLLQHGSGWWFNDTKAGITDQLTSLAALGILGNFIGMLTDSRSLLSYTRHEYFRRILCDLLGGWIENGEYPADIPFVGSMVKDICYYNAESYFNL